MPDSTKQEDRMRPWADLVDVMSEHLAAHERLVELSEQLTHELLNRDSDGVSRVTAEQSRSLALVERLESRRIAVVDALCATAEKVPAEPTLRQLLEAAPVRIQENLEETSRSLARTLERISIVTQTNKRLLVQADEYVRTLLKAAAGTETGAAAYNADGKSPSERSGRALVDRRA